MGKTDRRVRRTREALHKALMSLALEKEYDAITVQEVLDRADIGRSTFYTHFQNKDELLISGIHHLRVTLEATLEQQKKSAKRHVPQQTLFTTRGDQAHRMLANARRLTSRLWNRTYATAAPFAEPHLFGRS